MRKIRFLSAWIMTLALLMSCNVEDRLEAEGEFPVVISLTEGVHVKSILPDGLMDQVRSLGVYVYNSRGHLEQAMTADDSKVTVKLNRYMDYTVYALANFPSLPVAPAEESEFLSAVYDVPYDNLKECGIPMCGKADLNAADVLSGSVTIDLTRLITRVSFSLDKSLLSTSDLTVTSVRLCQTASATAPFADTFIPDGEMIESEGDMISEEDLDYLNSGGSVWMYCLENCQGVLLPENDDPWKKTPLEISDAAGRCTYIEVLARYTGDYEGVEVASDNVRYRFYLGKDNIRDFSLERNKGVAVSLVVSDSGVFEREWRVDYGKSLPVVTCSLDLSSQEKTLYASQSTSLKALYSRYVDGVLSSTDDVSSEVTWSIDDENVATIDGQIITGVANGTATVSASYDGVESSFEITVLKPSGELVFRDDEKWFYPYKEHDMYFTYSDLSSAHLDKRYFSAEGCEIVSVTVLDDDEGYVTVRRGGTKATTLEYHYPADAVRSTVDLISKDPELVIDGPDRIIQGADATYRVTALYQWPDGEMDSEDVSDACVWDSVSPAFGNTDGKGHYESVSLDPMDGDSNRYATITDVSCTYAGVNVEKEVLIYAYADFKFSISMTDSTRDAEYYRITLMRHIYDSNGEITEWSAKISYNWKLSLTQGNYYGTGNFNYKLEIDDKMEYINVKHASITATFRTAGEYNSEGMPWGSEVTLMRELELSGF